MQFILVFFILALTSFGFQLFTKRDWWLACDRTFFQGVAIFCLWLALPK